MPTALPNVLCLGNRSFPTPGKDENINVYFIIYYQLVIKPSSDSVWPMGLDIEYYVAKTVG